MGMFERIKRVLKGNLNQMISRAEDPEKMLNQLIIDMNQQLRESKNSVASAIVDEKRLERLTKSAYAETQKYEQEARSFVSAGKDAQAKEALMRKQEAEQQALQYREQWEAQHESVEKLKQALRQLQQKIDEAQRKKNLLIARSKRADAHRKIQETISSFDNNSAFETFDRMAREIEEKEIRNEAFEELEATKAPDSLDDEFAKLESAQNSPDRLLEDLKQRMKDEERSS
ncbi:MAG TPA: PspA/IM30 family protein [Sediminispirochaeta sp.]|nr:PspA/IM30 family protein [Sediminispirochaeta sp.]